MLDVLLGPDGDLTSQFQFVRGIPLILQRVRVRLETFLGEVPYDQKLGVPYFRWLGQKAPSLQEIENYIRREISTVPGVLRVDNLRATRTGSKVSIAASVVTPTEDALRIRVDLFGSGFGESGAAALGNSATPVVNGSPVVVVLLGTGTV